MYQALYMAKSTTTREGLEACVVDAYLAILKYSSEMKHCLQRGASGTIGTLLVHVITIQN